ncbi:hypothetical protein OH77DRAFT_244933 [Trametes cingulata]|nr:hypothetical protein OH77DRAFT_244933 [Trametes cingulata]
MRSLNARGEMRPATARGGLRTEILGSEGDAQRGLPTAVHELAAGHRADAGGQARIAARSAGLAGHGTSSARPAGEYEAVCAQELRKAPHTGALRTRRAPNGKPSFPLSPLPAQDARATIRGHKSMHNTYERTMHAHMPRAHDIKPMARAPGRPTATARHVKTPPGPQNRRAGSAAGVLSVPVVRLHGMSLSEIMGRGPLSR